jgi:predicted metal-binding membrane protein
MKESAANPRHDGVILERFPIPDQQERNEELGGAAIKGDCRAPRETPHFCRAGRKLMAQAVRVPSRAWQQGLVPALLLGLAAFGWWWSARMAHEMTPGMAMTSSMGPASMSFVAFVGAWVAMMAAMMFPAILPVIRIYRRAAGLGRAAPTPIFVAGYLLVWSAVGIPAYFAWRATQDPIANATPWAGRLAGAIFLVAALYQVSPLKSVCLRYCRSPMSFFLRQHRSLQSPIGAATAGATHGVLCLGCCWALMAILVALGTMQLAWMIALAAVIFIEKVVPMGERFARVAAAAFVVLGLLLVIHPASLRQLT